MITMMGAIIAIITGADTTITIIPAGTIIMDTGIITPIMAGTISTTDPCSRLRMDAEAQNHPGFDPSRPPI
jgi:hypothetical protein